MEEEDKKKQVDIIKERFRKRGYPENLYEEKIAEKWQVKDGDVNPLFITRYSKELLKIKILYKNIGM